MRAAERLREEGHVVETSTAADAIDRLDDGFDVVISSVAPSSPEPPTSYVPPPPRQAPSLLQLAPTFREDDVVAAVRDLESQAALDRSVTAARRTLRDSRESSGKIIGTSPELRRVRDRVDAAAASDAAVLLRGESGTGKELFARALHERGARRAGPLVPVNCASFPESLIEAELFGHERGAFTGATQRREGRFKAADGGTLFLDEVNGLSLAAQAKLLRVLQDGTFQPIGTNTTISVDVRLISATNRDLRTLVVEGSFREDLYYRIRVLEIELPPLRTRRGDLPLLVQHLLAKFTPRGREVPRVTPRAWAALASHPWPGNVRELEHALQHAAVLAQGGEIDLEHLPEELWPEGMGEGARGGADGEGAVRPLQDAMQEFEHAYVLRALNVAGGSRTRAAKLLGISRKTLWDRLRRHPDEAARRAAAEPDRLIAIRGGRP